MDEGVESYVTGGLMIHPSAFAKLMINRAFMMLSLTSQLTMSALEGKWRVQLKD